MGLKNAGLIVSACWHGANRHQHHVASLIGVSAHDMQVLPARVAAGTRNDQKRPFTGDDRHWHVVATLSSLQPTQDFPNICLILQELCVFGAVGNAHRAQNSLERNGARRLAGVFPLRHVGGVMCPLDQ